MTSLVAEIDSIGDQNLSPRPTRGSADPTHD
jgi:hypothetical protein